jgi:sugar phosphate permease
MSPASRSGALPPSVENPVYRKIAWSLMPFLVVCYVLAQVDRFNIGFAKLQFLQDLGLDDKVFGLAASAFYVGYMLFEVPSNWLLARIGVRKTLLRIMVFWGAVTCALMFARTANHFYVLRFLLGVAEAGFFPGILFYLTLWFPDRLRGRISTLFVTAIPASGIIGGPLAGWIMGSMEGVYGIHGWQWLFLIEGLPTIVLGVVAYYYLSDGPATASWLTASEKQQVAADLAADGARRVQKTGSDFKAALGNPAVWRLCLIYFAYFFAINATLLWSPSLLKGVGQQTVGTVGLASGIIATVATIGMILVGRNSDRMLERRWHIAGCGLAAAAGFLLLPLAAQSFWATGVLLIVISTGVYGVLGLFWTIPSSFLQGSAAAAGIALINSFGALAGSLGPTLIGWIKVQTGSLYVGLSVVGLLLIISMLSLLWLVPSGKPAIRPAVG